MRCFPAAVFCCLLLLSAVSSQSAAPASGNLPVMVHDRNGMPLTGVRLILQPSGRTMLTDAKGTVTFMSLPPGPYTVSLAPAGYSPLTLPITLAADAASSLTCVMEKSGASTVTTQDAAGRHFLLTGPLVLRLVNPPPEYLLTPPVPPGSGSAWRTFQEDALREAMFRYLIDNAREPFGQDNTKHFSVCYLSVEEGKDPSPALLERLQNTRLPVQPVSALSRRSRNWASFQVSGFHWVDNNNLKIEAASSQFGVFSSVSLTYTLTLRNGWWEITGSLGISA